MKTIAYLALFFGLSASLTGCAVARFQSNIKTQDVPDFHRILVVSRLPKTTATYLPTFQTSFPAGYQVCILSNSPISFDSPEQAIQQQRQECQSEVMLTIDFSRNYTTGYGHYISANNELLMEMTNLATGKPFWKAIVTTSGSNEVPPRQIVNQLIKDGIVEGVLPNGNSLSATR
jgi:hypothetical protein